MDRASLQIVSLEQLPAEDLLAALRDTPLRDQPDVRPYANADLQLTPPLDTGRLTPAQRYVLTPRIQLITELREALLARGVDLFALRGGLRIGTSANPHESIPLTPPIVEESSEPGGHTVLLINDGLHRVFAARMLGKPISVVLVRGVPAKWPYYAYALPGGWAEVSELESLPDVYQKKSYRQPDNYKALFRDFNAVLPGIQAQRKRSNPSNLRA